MKKQARFWTFHSGDVRIKLNAGQIVHHSHGGRTDEGYHWETSVYHFDGREVTCEWSTDSQDCDGRMTRGGFSRCALRNLDKGHREGDVIYPAWEHLDENQRDFSAEAAGY